MLGHERVGKTSVINRYCKNTFNYGTKETQTPDCQDITEVVNNDSTQPGGSEILGELNMQIWDTAG